MLNGIFVLRGHLAAAQKKRLKDGHFEKSNAEKQHARQGVLLTEERRRLKELAESTGRNLSTYMLRVGMRYKVKTILDNKRVEELSRINGDMSRLSNMLPLDRLNYLTKPDNAPCSG